MPGKLWIFVTLGNEQLNKIVPNQMKGFKKYKEYFE